LSLRLDFLQNPDFHWLPHLTPSEGFVVGQHVFRSPAIVTADSSVVVAVIPDLDLVGKDPDLPWFLDMDAEKQMGWIGFTKTEIPLHVGFKKTPGLTVGPGKIELSFYVLAYRDSESPLNPWREVTKFLWNKWGRPLYQTGEPGTVPMDVYVRRTYEWAFESWADSVWQEFEINGTRVGAPQFIVNISQSPNYTGTWYQREFLSIWNQAWFSSLRSATGLARWAIRTEDNGLLEKANLTKALALSAPMNNGIFPSVIRTDNLKLEVEGKTIDRPEPWSEGYWSNSNRAPSNYGIDQNWYHLLDSSWTALLMLRWFEEIEEDHALLEYAKEYADKLISLQDKDGFFPGWLKPETLEPGSVMNRTPESSLSATFLFKLWDLNGEQRHLEAGLKAVDAVLEEIVPEGRWEDFETYWSCCQFWNDQVGEKIPRNDQYKQNTLSMFWTAEALLEAYRQTEDEKYLKWGVRTLDELSMYQQVWQPPFIYIPAVGGFGVMNFDAEWNDSRESLFAELYLDYYAITGNRDYFERGVAALKSSFVMMYCPENPKQKVQWEKAHPFFGPEDYGFTMENYGHGGETSPEGMGMGVFTIYDWGNGAASEARNRIHDHYGDVYIDRERGEAFGIDSISVTKTDQGWSLENLSATPRELRVVFEDGSSKDLSIEKKTMLKADE
ncbi:MAG: hypothetical protein KC978_08180, partial [Candidatus Omnitrophica bacterium]|nr:hypothetical protein [Candidatus Omnitrophota bacterium]